jgi:filamentous hemagglutinin family protein
LLAVNCQLSTDLRSSTSSMKIQYLLSLLSIVAITSIAPFASAQTYEPTNRIPLADNSLGTQVSRTNDNFTITGGLDRGQNLFHSFTDFSVPTGGAATFDNSLGKQSIITRVTGGNFSDINGLVNTQGANLFLINPNGIVFGTNAQLNVGQTFVGSTAKGIDLVDGGGNSVNFGIDRSGDAKLLTINPNALFNVSGLNMGGGNGQINNFGTLQTANPNQYIGLIGGNISMNGGQIIAPGGRVELTGLSATGTVNLVTQGNNFSIQLPNNVNRSDVSLTNGSGVSVTGADGGEITINARNIEVSGGSQIFGGINEGLGTPTAVAGDIKLDATGNIVISGTNSAIGNNILVNATGKGGNITIDANTISLGDGVQISTSIRGVGDAGNVIVKAEDTVTFNNISIFSNIEAGGVGKGGKIDITAGSLSLGGSQVQTIVRGANSSQQAGKGNAGDITVKVTGAVDLAGRNEDFPSTLASSTGTGTEGNGGNITVEAGSVSLRDDAVITASTRGVGNAGNVTVTAKDVVTLNSATAILSTVNEGGVGKGGKIDITAGSLSLGGGQLATIVRGANSSQPAGKGNAGDITVEAGSVSLRDGALITASTRGVGNAGNVTVTAKDAVTLNNNAAILSTVDAGGVGQGGRIDITAGSLSLGSVSQVLTTVGGANSSQPAGKGNAGDITVKVTGAVDIAGRNEDFISSKISSSNLGSEGATGTIDITAKGVTLNEGLIQAFSNNGQGGDIKINISNLLLLRNNSLIITDSGSSQQNGNGGNITINAPTGFIVTAPNENSDISANAYSGSGGKVTIKTQQNFWISPLSRAELEKLLGTTDPTQLDPFNLPTNNITAISQVNPNLNGQVTTTPPEIDPTRGLSPLPNNVTDPTNQINPNCSARAIANNSFTSVGRGGIPATPKDPLNEQEIATNWVMLNPKDAVPSIPIATAPAQLPQPLGSAQGKPIVEAQGWRQERNGDIVLVAGASLETLPRQPQPQSGCAVR